VTTDQWSENKAQVATFVRDGHGWRQDGGDFSARIGRNGFSDGSTERTEVTPSGSFGLVTSFGAVANPGTSIPYRTVEPSDCWITNRNIPEFDHWVATPDCIANGTPMLEPEGPLQLAIVTDHYPPADPTLPRRVFLRCYEYSPGQAPLPTSGDVSMRREDLLDLLLWLDPAQSPVVVLGVEDWLRGNSSDAPSDAPWDDLSYGDTGESVSQLQQALTDQGIPTNVDGLFYDQTQASVKTFQKQQDLPETGVVDAETASRLGLYPG
jgi:L,D-peptidoglycan transpeptidase YkuD (ErfK/YbiS/YcfS/YnhG family)